MLIRSLFLLMLIACIGCSPVEIAKTVWGSSTRALEDARITALTKDYDKSYWDTMRAAIDVMKRQGWTIFKKDEVAGIVVLMGVHGSVNTTEIGVFFVEVSENQTRVEISSLSTNAKRMVAKRLFHGIDVAFGLAQLDPAIDNPVIDPTDEDNQEEVKDKVK